MKSKTFLYKCSHLNMRVLAHQVHFFSGAKKGGTILYIT